MKNLETKCLSYTTVGYSFLFFFFFFQYFNNEKYEVQRYNTVQKEYEDASLKTATSLALLNFGQNAIFSASLATLMVLTSKGIMAGRCTIMLSYFTSKTYTIYEEPWLVVHNFSESESTRI